MASPVREDYPSPAASTPYLKPRDLRFATDTPPTIPGFATPVGSKFSHILGSPPATPLISATPRNQLRAPHPHLFSPIDSNPPTPTFSSPPKSLYLLSEEQQDSFYSMKDKKDDVKENLTITPLNFVEGTPESAVSIRSVKDSPVTPYVAKSRYFCFSPFIFTI